MKYLTFLDYTTLQATGKNIVFKLSEKDKEIQSLKEQMLSMQESHKEIMTLLKDPSRLLEVLKEK
jgi:hypothetical protein